MSYVVSWLSSTLKTASEFKTLFPKAKVPSIAWAPNNKEIALLGRKGEKLH